MQKSEKNKLSNLIERLIFHRFGRNYIPKDCWEDLITMAHKFNTSFQKDFWLKELNEQYRGEPKDLSEQSKEATG